MHSVSPPKFALLRLSWIIASTHWHIVKQSLLFVSTSANRTRLDVCTDRHLPVGTCPSEKILLRQALQPSH